MPDDEPTFDMSSLFEMAQSMQSKLLDAQAAAAATELEGQSGGGAVRVTVTGGLEFRSVRIDPSAVDPADIGMLEDLVLAAVNDAVLRVNAAQQEALGGLGAMAGGLGGLGGLPPGPDAGDVPPRAHEG